MASHQFQVGDPVRVIGGTATYAVVRQFVIDDGAGPQNAYDAIGDESGDNYSACEDSFEGVTE